ncbi:MAG: NAD(P)/FAD-dependent oxidoreductase [Labilithrix sp.]|nr:NAD(P)/FAD-dependent oxidoreductase [Labilithrix sp.]MCW5816215.1 NAD(P)/FAD-dependent oxidoreductase [Labilithrix sp.]
MTDFDVIIVGAGLSGIGAGYRLKTECPTKTFAILEARGSIGGTWDLFRYPGIRSDSDMFTLGYPFHPWKEAKAIADGPSILSYIKETSTKFGIDPHVRFHHKILEASWSSDAQRWTLVAEVGDGETKERKTYRCKFLYLCAGYYSYDKAHAPVFEGADTFGGKIVHPQWWPEDLDYSNKRVVVIGSGATAVTLVPALAEKAAHVTMLQRSPSYIASLPAEDAIGNAIRKVLPEQAAHSIVRTKNMLMNLGFYQFCRRHPKLASRLLRKEVAKLLPKDFPAEHFTPRYDPWDQRLCLVPDADLFHPIRAGKADVVTDTIERFTPKGILLKSGKELAADVIVTATGLRIQAVGGVKFEVDGRAIEPKDVLVYKGLMLSGIPNLAWCVGYTNASWTLRADLTSRYVCRLLNLMDKKGHRVAVPRASAGDVERRPLLDLTSGYVARAASDLPKQGSKAPWYLRQNYVLDFVTMTFGPVDDSISFS